MLVVNCKTWDDFRSRLLVFASRPRATRDSFAFRGHADSAWKMETTLDREYPNLKPLEREQALKRLLADFASEILGVERTSQAAMANDRLELLGRHHGLPTTVIDWTRSPYVAAYFAFEGTVRPSSDMVSVWCFDKRKIGYDVVLETIELMTENIRAIEQRGVFIRVPHGVMVEQALGAGLTKFTIPYGERALALADLDSMLITRRALFRDYDSAAKTAIIRESLR